MLPALLTVMGAASSCNSKTDPDNDEPAVTISTLAVRNFSLKADSKVLANLDSVFFSIDLDKGVIFNADSLPKGTKISRLIPVITFQSSMTEAKIIMEGGSEKNDTIDYLTNATDSVDFSRKVTLAVTALDGTSKYSYRIKVNVHTQKPDSLMWDKMAEAPFPSRLADPVEQKSVETGGKVYTMILENDGSMTMAVADDIYNGRWTGKELSLPFEADVRSLTATPGSESTPGALWILSADGSLYTSADGIDWAETGEKGWISITGRYLDCVLGIKGSDGGGLDHCHFPASDLIADTPVDASFPLREHSEFITMSSKWTPNPTGILAGGVTASGEASSAVWAFDGSRWAVISEGQLPALRGPVLVKYTVRRHQDTAIQQKNYEVWLAFSGKTGADEFNRTLYISYDNGVTWVKGATLLQLPEYFPSLTGADAVVLNSPLSGDLANAWETRASADPGRWLTRSYTLDGYEITWDCPFIYVLGGDMASGTLSDSIWRGVIARLKFIPII